MDIKYDLHNIVQPKIFLARPGEKLVCIVNGIVEDSCQFSQNLKQFDTLQFDIDRYIWDEENSELISTNYYTYFDVHMELFLENVGWFRIVESPTFNYTGDGETKTIVAESIETELQDYDLVGFRVNCGTTDSIEMFEGNYDTLPTGVQIAKNQIVFYSPTHEEYSLLNIICSYTKRWQVGHVDASLYGKIAKFDVDTTNIYSFLNNDISTAYECIIIFDYMNFTINAYSLDDENRINQQMLKDTNTILSFRSLQNQIDRSNAEDVYTVYRISGGEDLNIRLVNFGENTIENLSYFLKTRFVSSDFISHYRQWYNYRESRREEYIESQINYQKNLENINYIRDRVPTIGVTTDWPKMEDDEILSSYQNYTALKIALENLYKDSQGNFDINLIKASPDWADYKECVNYTIPALENEIGERGLDDNISSSGIADYDYDSWKTDWDLYGLKELKIKLDEYKEQIKIYTENGFNKNKQSGDKYTTEYWNEQHQNYLTAVSEKNSCQTAYNTRKNEYNTATSESKRLSNISSQIVKDVNVEKQDSAYFHLTADDLYILWKLRNEVDYTNENIFTTSIDNVESTIERQRELLEDAKKQLEIYSSVQYNYNTSLDNLLALYDYKDSCEDFVCGNYIRVMPYENYQLKLRIIKISYNPLMMENDLQIVFSNFLTTKNERTDKASLLSISNNIAKNSISTSTQSSGADVTSELVGAILRSSQFQNSTTNLIGNIVGTVAGNVTVAGTITTDALVTKLAEIEEAQIERLDASTAFINYLNSNLVVAKALMAEEATIANLATTALSANSIDANNIDTSNLTADSGFISYLNSNLVVANAINARNATIAGSVKAENIDTSTLSADSAIIKYLESNLIVSEALEAGSVKAENIDTSTLTTDSAIMRYLRANLIVASEIDVDDLKAKLATIDNLTAGSAFVNYLQSLNSTAVTSIVNEQYVRNLVAGKISVGDLAAGNIVLTDTMQILSDNGKMVMNGSALQIRGEDSQGNEYVGIQLGYDTNQNPSLILRNEDGATILTPSGITSDAVADGLIVNDMIHDSTISKSKLGFQIIEPNAQGGVDITQVYDGSGNNFGIQYTSFKQNTEQVLNDIESQKMYRVQIESNNGNIFKNGDISCVLSCRVFSWDEDITDEINAANFKWKRKSKNTEDDTAWNARHAGGTKSIEVTSSDVYGRSVFYCEVTLPDGTIQASD